MGDGVEQARKAVDDGAAFDVLERLVARDRASSPARARVSADEMGMIEDLVGSARAGVERRSAEVPLGDLEQRLAERPEQRPFGEALTRPGLSVIAEFKRRSPSAGEIRAGGDARRDRPRL